MSNKAYDLPLNPAGQSHARWQNKGAHPWIIRLTTYDFSQ